jgi:hypothetical protein
MTQQELDAEWGYRFTERLGILCGTDNPTPAQVEMAIADADIAVARLGPALEEMLI